MDDEGVNDEREFGEYKIMLFCAAQKQEAGDDLLVIPEEYDYLQSRALAF